MPSTSPAQHRLMEAAAHTPGGVAGVSQAVGREFVNADAVGEPVPAAVAEPIAPQAGAAGRAAGIIFLTPAGERLFMHRGDGGDFPRTWGLPGGHQEEGETLEQCARREALEETGFDYQGPLTAIYDNGQFCNFLAKIDEPFAVTICDESTGYSWATEPPLPAHPSLANAFRVLAADTELAVAELMRDGVLPSPQVYRNIFLVDLRITGTGMAFRAEIQDDEGKIERAAEHVYRDASLYLNPEFLARCNGLPVILDHPEDAVLNAEEFEARISGTCMLPYIKGEEVWSIARIYAKDAIEEFNEALKAEGTISTSPTVIFNRASENVQVMLENGEALLIEGKPVLLDHIAIVSKSRGGKGVWDKGGPSSGVNLSNGELAMADEDTKKADEEAKAKADAAGSDKLDKVLAAVDGLNTRMDSFEKARADEVKAKADSEEKAKADADEKAKADADAKAKADAEADKNLKADSEAEEKKADEDAEAMADSQAKADAVFVSLGSSAPRPLKGEGILAYGRRMASKLKIHSPKFKDIDIRDSRVVSDAMFPIVADQIYADAQAAARNPAVVAPDGGLREIKRTGAGGRVISEFVGSPRSCWAPFMAETRHVSQFNKGV